MKRRFTILTAALALLVFMAPTMVGWGQTREAANYQIVFKTGSGDGTSINTNTSCSTIVSSGANYLSGNVAAASNAYHSGGSGLKLGTSSGAGVLTMNLSSAGQVTPTSIVVSAKRYNTSKSATLSVNGATAQTVSNSSSFNDYTFVITSPITTLQLNSSKYIWVASVTVNYTTGGGQQTVAAPEFNPAEGTYATTQTVSISCATNGATIHYTTDGTTPTSSSAVYSTPLSISQTTTVKAIAMLQGYNDSPVASATYTIETPSFNQDWEGTMHGWTFVSVTGSQEWSVAGNASNHYAKMNGYANSSSNANVDWCISPAFDLGDYSNPILTFETAKNFTGADLEVYFSDDYNGDPTAATWTQLSCTLSPGNNSWAFISSGDIDLSNYSGSSCYIGFKYTSTSLEAATWEVDNIELEDRQIVVTHSLIFSASPAEGGSISVGNNLTSPATVAEGDQLAIAATANTGYTFSGWTVSGTGASVADANSASTTFTMGTADATLTATFTSVQTYTVTYHANGPSGVADVTETYNAGATVNVAANTFYYAGHAFTKWNTAAAGTGTDYLPAATISNIQANIDLYAQWEEDNDMTYDFHFTTIGDEGWTNGYSNHNHTYIDGTTVYFNASSKQTSTITDIPVTKTGPISIVMNNEVISAVTFVCRQWGNKAQTITLLYSTDGGDNYTTTGVTSSNFTITCNNLPAGTNAVQITFSEASNQIGVESATVTKGSATPAVSYTLSLGNDANINDYFMYAGTESNDIEFDQNGEVEINAGTTVYVSVEAEECYVMNGLNVTYGNNQTATVTTLEPHVYYSFVMPEADATLNFVTAQAQQYELTVGTLSHVTLEMRAGEESNEVEDGDDICEGSNVTIEATAEQGYVLQSVNVVDGNDDPVTVNSQGNGVYSFTMPSRNVTVSATAVLRTLNTYTLATSITPGATYLITNGSDKAMGKQNNNNRAAADVEGNAGVIIVDSSDEDVYEFVIEEVTTGTREGETLYTIQDVRSEKYLCSTNANNNYLKEQEELSDNGKWTISIDANGVATIVAQSGSRTNMRYNSNNDIFSCYASGQQDIYLYVKNANPQTQTYTKQIAAYQGAGGYSLIASPVIGVVPTASNGFLTNAYDFYYFDQAQQDEWRNFEAGSFDLISGKGYLYASATATTLTFTGEPYNGNGQVALTYDANADLPGWNLIGNPFPATAYLSDSRSFYEMKADGTEIIANIDDEIAAMEGIFVVAADDNDNSVTFTTTAPAQTESIVLNVSRNRNEAIDRAIVRFGEGGQLPKFQLNPNNTKIYITEGDQEYAVVRSGNDAEIPVSFRASENGSYTISVDAENMEMNYLHLIDNMTGADVDLLATPSYTFEAKTTDYASRFRLVFSAEENGASTGSATFAFFNGSEWTISNIGEATLQVVDVMGRILSTETVNGNATISLNQVPGVYMLRLVNGNNVRTQKVVVR